MATKAELQAELKARDARIAKLKRKYTSILHTVRLNCSECCGNSITEAKRCGMKNKCPLYQYNPRYHDSIKAEIAAI